MIVDITSDIKFNDPAGLRNFMLDHRFTHARTTAYVSAHLGIQLPDILLLDSNAENDWLDAMANQSPVSPSLRDWLERHAELHQAEYYALLLGQTPDLAVADFSNEEGFYFWMYAHRQLHDAVASSIGVT